MTKSEEFVFSGIDSIFIRRNIAFNILCQIDESKLIFCRVSVDKYFD